ncbi:hypothetical protein CMO88_03375 [Candidatus Woesearchaeota archaeon]|nr:hypothetical protein [Candidatus Woesearchaeota archaeon]|tara:strand:- start:9556 stop:9750 length:195 start_codon:yes stop_codon:yes gene_type:complete
MEVFIEADNKKRKIKFSGTASQLLKKLNVNSETVIIAKNNELVSEEENLKDKDEIKLLSVISGG